MNRIAVLGATGSIGRSALDVMARHRERFTPSVLIAHRNVEALAELCAVHRPELAVIGDASLLDDLAGALARREVRCALAAGDQAIVDAARGSLCDSVLAAIVGAAGLPSTLAAARAGKRLLLANKESAVMAGPLLRAAITEGGAPLVPVDSEHNALFQCLPGGNPRAAGVKRLILTASGGPFRGCKRSDLVAIDPDQACAHPKWEMGRKISVDSATLMNKGLEVIEAHVLFELPSDQIEVLVHPQSTVHSLVEYVDGSHLAQLGVPDMRTAIAHALAWPDRVDAGVAPLDLTAGPLEFEHPDTETFRCLALARQALEAGGDAPAVLNAANEEAVAAFLERRLPFLAIAEVVEESLQEVAGSPLIDVAQLLERDQAARLAARRIIARQSCSGHSRYNH